MKWGMRDAINISSTRWVCMRLMGFDVLAEVLETVTAFVSFKIMPENSLRRTSVQLKLMLFYDIVTQQRHGNVGHDNSYADGNEHRRPNRNGACGNEDEAQRCV